MKVLKILGNRSLRRLNWSRCKSVPEKSFLKLVAGEEARLARTEKTYTKIDQLIERLIDFTNEKEANHARNLKMVAELHALQRSVLADMVQETGVRFSINIKSTFFRKLGKVYLFNLSNFLSPVKPRNKGRQVNCSA